MALPTVTITTQAQSILAGTTLALAATATDSAGAAINGIYVSTPPGQMYSRLENLRRNDESFFSAAQQSDATLVRTTEVSKFGTYVAKYDAPAPEGEAGLTWESLGVNAFDVSGWLYMPQTYNSAAPFFNVTYEGGEFMGFWFLSNRFTASGHIFSTIPQLNTWYKLRMRWDGISGHYYIYDANSSLLEHWEDTNLESEFLSYGFEFGLVANGESSVLYADNVGNMIADNPIDVQWSSDIDGPLGIGNEISTSQLSPGVHTITASVTDVGVGSDQVIIEVLSARLPAFIVDFKKRFLANFRGVIA